MKLVLIDKVTIKNKMLDLGLTATDIEKKIDDISYATVANIVSGRTSPTTGNAKQIADILEVKATELFKWEEDDGEDSSDQ